MRAFALHLRAGQLWIVALVLTTCDLALIGLRSHYWVGIWPESGAAAASPASFLSIAAAGIAAWVSGARAREHLTEQLEAAGRHRVQVEGTRLAAVLVAVLAPYAVGAGVTFALTAATFPPGVGLWGAYVAIGAVLMTTATGWGWLLGRYLGARAASIAAVATWLLFLAFVAAPAGLVVVSGPAWLTPSPTGVALPALAAVLLLVAVVVALPPTRPWRRRRAPAAVPLAATALVVVAVLATPGIVLRPVPPDPLCTTNSAARFCLWPEHATYQDALGPLGDRIAALPEQLTVPDELREYGLDRIDPLGTGAVEPTGDFLISEGRTEALASTVANAITAETFAPCSQDCLVPGSVEALN